MAVIVVEMYSCGDDALGTNQRRPFPFHHFLICHTQLFDKLLNASQLWNQQHTACKVYVTG